MFRNNVFEKAIKDYYRKLKKEYKNLYGTIPSIPFSKQLNKDMLVGKEDEEGYIGWKPIKQHKDIDWEKLSSEGLIISESLKPYYSEMCFAPIEGKYKDIIVRLDSVGLHESAEDTVRKQFRLGFDQEDGNIYAVIGSVEIEGDDAWELCYDNTEDCLFYFNEQEAALVDEEKEEFSDDGINVRKDCDFDILTLISNMEVVC